MQNDRYAAGSAREREQGPDLYSIFLYIVKHWLILILVTASVTLLSYTALSVLHPNSYASSATLVIQNMNESGTYAMDSTNKLQNFFTGEEIRNAVARDLGMDRFNGSAGIERLGNSNMLKVSVRADSPTLAYQEMQSIIRNYEKIASELIINMKMAVLETPKLPEAPANAKQNVKYALALGIAALVIVCTWLAARYFVRDAARRSRKAGKRRNSGSSADQKGRIVDADIDLDPARLFIDVLDGFFEKAWLFIILMIIGGVQCFFAARLRYMPYYEASTSFTVNTVSRLSDKSNVRRYALATTMGYSFPYVLKSDTLKNMVEQDMKSRNPEGSETYSASISASNIEETNLVTLKVRSADPQYAYDAMQSVLRNYPSVSNKVLGEAVLTQLDESGVPTSPANAPASKKAAAAGAILVLFFCLAWLTFRSLRQFIYVQRTE